MDRRTLKNVLFPALTVGTAVIMIIVVLANRTVDSIEIPPEFRAQTRPMLLPDGSPAPLDPAFLLPIPAAAASRPSAFRFDAPLGGENGAFTYDAQPFLQLNKERRGKHLGDDLNGIGGRDTDLGDPVFATADGRVAFSGSAGAGWGLMVIVEHALPAEKSPPAEQGKLRPSIQSVYAHLGKSAVAPGMPVRRGDRIGTVGNADGAYFAHLHFEIRDSESPDPSRGYAADGALNRLSPTAWLADHRNAPPELLNAPPREPVPFVQIIGPEG